MARADNKIHTVFHSMDAKGYFDSNPANPNSRDSEGRPLYKGPLKYPMQMYHPKGQEEVIRPATAQATPFGPVMMGEQKQLIQITVNSAEEERRARAQGWHDHPAKAIEAADDPKRPVPPMGAQEQISSLENQVALLESEKTKLERERAKFEEEKAAFFASQPLVAVEPQGQGHLTEGTMAFEAAEQDAAAEVPPAGGNGLFPDLSPPLAAPVKKAR